MIDVKRSRLRSATGHLRRRGGADDGRGDVRMDAAGQVRLAADLRDEAEQVAGGQRFQVEADEPLVQLVRKSDVNTVNHLHTKIKDIHTIALLGISVYIFSKDVY